MLVTRFFKYDTFFDPYADLPVSEYRRRGFGSNSELNRKKTINEHALLMTLVEVGAAVHSTKQEREPGPEHCSEKYGNFGEKSVELGIYVKDFLRNKTVPDIQVTEYGKPTFPDCVCRTARRCFTMFQTPAIML